MNGDLRKSVKHHITGQNEGVVSLHILKLCLREAFIKKKKKIREIFHRWGGGGKKKK